MSELAVRANSGYVNLELPFSADKMASVVTKTYILLHHFDRRRNEIRSELSLPTGFIRRRPTDSRGVIKVWGDRIILPSINFEPARPTAHVIDDEEIEDYSADVQWKDAQN